MKLPEIVKRIGYTDGEERIYIEDYVHSYLNGLREKKEIFPVRAALFGHVIQKEEIRYYLIYGACCVVEELFYGKTEGQIGKEFFPEYKLIGYVNINRNSRILEDKGKGYFVFYETNEPMQRYLACCFERENRQGEKKAAGSVDFKQEMSLPAGKSSRSMGERIRLILYGLGVLVLAMAISTINDYEKIQGFVEMTGEAVRMAETEG